MISKKKYIYDFLEGWHVFFSFWISVPIEFVQSIAVIFNFSAVCFFCINQISDLPRFGPQPISLTCLTGVDIAKQLMANEGTKTISVQNRSQITFLTFIVPRFVQLFNCQIAENSIMQLPMSRSILTPHCDVNLLFVCSDKTVLHFWKKNSSSLLMINNTCPNLLLFKNRKFSLRVKRKKSNFSKVSPNISCEQSEACRNASGLE